MLQDADGNYLTIPKRAVLYVVTLATDGVPSDEFLVTVLNRDSLAISRDYFVSFHMCLNR